MVLFIVLQRNEQYLGPLPKMSCGLNVLNGEQEEEKSYYSLD